MQVLASTSKAYLLCEKKKREQSDRNDWEVHKKCVNVSDKHTFLSTRCGI